MEQSPSWEGNGSATSQEVSCILWDLTVHYCTHKSSPLVPILNQMNSVHDLPSCFFKIYFNMLPSIPRSSKWYISLRFPQQNPVCTSPVFRMCPFTWSSLHSLHTLPLWDPSIFLSPLFLNTFILCFSLTPIQNNRQNTVLCILIAILVDSTLEDWKVLHQMIASIPHLHCALNFSWMEFWVVSVGLHIWTVPCFQRTYYLSFCCDFVYHSGHKIWSCTEFSLHVLLDQLPC